jgi:hypothetical protein
MRGYRAISDWAQGLGPKARGRFHCHYESGRYVVPSEYIIRKILTTDEFNQYLNFHHVGQAFVIERHFIEKKIGKQSIEIGYGITSPTPEQAGAQGLFSINRGHCSIDKTCYLYYGLELR